MPQAAPLQASDPTHVGRYQLTARVTGLPSSGSAYLARDSGGEVTVSLLEGDWTAAAAERDRFTLEARAACQVAPQCAARIVGSGFDAGRAYLVSEYVAGPTLAELVAAKGRRKGRELAALALGTAAGLAAIHQAGLVHGAFSPDHVVLGRPGPRVIEYGISPPYGPATPSADMRAWAHTVLYAAAGRPAGAADLPLLPEPLRALTARCLTADPGDPVPALAVVTRLLGTRVPAAAVLAEASRRAAAAVPRQPVLTQPEPAPQRRRRSRRKVTIWSAAAAAAAAAAAVLIAVGVHVALSPGAGLGALAGPPPGQASATADPRTRPQPPAPPAKIPARMAGTWSGMVTQSGPGGPDMFTVRVVLPAGATSGTVSYAGTSVSCDGNLGAVAGTTGRLTLSQAITQGPCLRGSVTLAAGPAGTLAFSFRGTSGPTATGTLRQAAGS